MKTFKAFLKDMLLMVTYAAMFTGAWWLVFRAILEQ